MDDLKFSVLISVYKNDNPAELKTALESVWDRQTLRPNEIVIVEDGPIPEELSGVIAAFAEKAPVRRLPQKVNRGLGAALAVGVSACTYDYIARMDSDDISCDDRFQKQIGYLREHPEVDICGSAIAEFESDPAIVSGIRSTPEKHKDIRKFLNFRNPVNHVTAFFRKKAILDAGNYQPLIGYEDYWLWARCLQKQAVFHNLGESLVQVRIGNNMHARRRGFKLIRSEIALYWGMYKIGLLSLPRSLMSIAIKAPVRLLPKNMIKIVYNKFLRRH